MRQFVGFQRMGWTLRQIRKTNDRIVFLIVLLICLGQCRSAWTQAPVAARTDYSRLSAGVGFSGDYLQYGERKLGGIAAWVDYDTRFKLGIEAEGNWMRFGQQADVRADTYLAGLRYHLNVGRLQPYLKGLVGVGEFNFPYNYAHGSYLVAAPGGGVDYRLNHRWSVRADVEYQYWPEFTYGAMSSGSVTIGIRRHIF